MLAMVAEKISHAFTAKLADACNADASDAYDFDKAVSAYLDNKVRLNQVAVTDFSENGLK
jgi:hexosaminidase